MNAVMLATYPKECGQECTCKLQVKPGWGFQSIIVTVLPDDIAVVVEDHAKSCDKPDAEKGSLLLSRK